MYNFIPNAQDDSQLSPDSITTKEHALPISEHLLSVQEISAKVGILYDRTMWLLRRYIYSHEETIKNKAFAKSFETLTNNITKNLRERKFDKVKGYLADMREEIKKINLDEPETAKFIFPNGVNEAMEALDQYASNAVALTLQEG